jgi:DNA modification methylase
MGQLFYGDNLEVLRKDIEPMSVDLIYLDPPFNSKKLYNIIFKEEGGKDSVAQATAFDDSWRWTDKVQREYDEIRKSGKVHTYQMLSAFLTFLGKNDMMAYLVTMTNRLLEMRTVLKDTGSLYLHCDPTASGYLRTVLDSIFGPENFRNEITWKRTTAHSDARRYGANTDTIFFYTKSDNYTFNPIFQAYTPKHVKRFKHKDPDGRMWSDGDLSAKGLAGGGYTYEYKGITSVWRCPLTTMRKLDAENRLHFTKGHKGIRLKKYLDELPGLTAQSLWDDIPPLNSQAKERLGYPTQKPLALLERIISVSSNEGDLVLDPFCGCGTAIHAAQNLNREWAGIDVTHLAISVIEKRMREAFNITEIEVTGRPADPQSARSLANKDKYEFQYWACSLVNAYPQSDRKKKGGDGGIDGIILSKAGAKDCKIIVSIKGGESLNPSMIRDLNTVVDREGAAIGLFVTMYPATAGMRKEATGCGYVKLGDDNYPKIQILQVDDLMDGTASPKYPNAKLIPRITKRAEPVFHQGTLFSTKGNPRFRGKRTEPT